MCKKTKGLHNRIDPCMIHLIRFVDFWGKNGGMGSLKVVACCCGHLKYPMTIVVKNHREQIWDLVSNTGIPRKRKFYKKDKQGYYYIPECVKDKLNKRVSK